MALDTLYRPHTYDGVLGQSSTVQILRQYVKSGAGFSQSYLFAGPWGSGKTTLARVLARSLLCSAPVEGAACDKCLSCQSILIGGSSENFFEIDAATNSGKDSIRKIVEEIQYSTFSGNKRLYLFDESHRLSADALDALLKPMEDCVPGTQDKTLVCIFCTTEPEKMRATVLSRCAPAFVIRPVTPDQIRDRLVTVCDSEGIDYEPEALKLIGELTECHIRDALKAVEGVSMLGKVDRINVAKYLHLDSHLAVLEILSLILEDLPGALRKASELLATTSPTTCYENLAETAILAYRVSIGAATPPSYLNEQTVLDIGKKVGTRLLSYASRFSSRPGRPTASMLLCDVAQLHQEAVAPILFALPVAQKSSEQSVVGNVKPAVKSETRDGVYVLHSAVKVKDKVAPPPKPQTQSFELQPLDFFVLVKKRVAELKESKLNGRSGQQDLGSSGADQDGGAESD